MSDDTGNLALVIAAVNDSATKARLAKLQAAKQEIEDAQASLDQSTKDNQAVIAGIREERQKLAGLAEALRLDREQFEQEKATLTAVVNGHNDERARWEEQRKIVEAQHASKEKELGSHENDLIKKHQAVNGKQEELDQREAAVVERETKMERWHSAFEAARQAV